MDTSILTKKPVIYMDVLRLAGGAWTAAFLVCHKLLCENNLWLLCILL